MKKYPKAEARSQVEAYRCWHRLLPNSTSDKIDSFIRAKHVYETLVGKLHLPMTLSSFCKLVKVKQISMTYQKVQLELIYKRLMQINKAGTMDLQIFFDALNEIGRKVFY